MTGSFAPTRPEGSGLESGAAPAAPGHAAVVPRVLRFATPVVLALVLLWLLAFSSDLTWPDILRAAGHFAGPALPCLVVLTAVNLGLCTLKWLVALRAFATDHAAPPRFLKAMLATTLGAMLGQVLPFQIGVALARSLAARSGLARKPGANILGTAYEQLFDAIVLGIAALFGLAAIVLRPGAVGWVLLTVLFLALGFFVTLRLGSLFRLTARLLGRARFGFARRILSLAAAAERAAGFPASVTALMFCLSVLRYATVLLWIAVALAALGMSEYAMRAIIALPILQTIALLPVTPGNWGVLEWTWSAVLVSAGAAISAAALFSVTIRILNLAILTILLLFCFLLSHFGTYTRHA